MKVQAALLALFSSALPALALPAAAGTDPAVLLTKRSGHGMEEKLLMMQELHASLRGNQVQEPIPADLGAADDKAAAALHPSFAAVAGDAVEPTAGCTKCNSSLHFAGKAASKYAVGTQLPSLPFKTKNSWAGLMPISQGVGSALYFYLWGKDAADAGDDVVVWLNGGPGCSALGGMLTENGPFLYESVKEKPYPNPYSWTRAATMLYVEQPIGTGFTTGAIVNTNEDQVAAQFASFLDNFFKTFPELAGKRLFITGESYAGQYIPYIMNYQYTHGNKHNLHGGIIIDGVITDTVTLMDLVTNKYAEKNADIIGLTASDLAEIKSHSDQCNLTNYTDTYLRYPAEGKLPDYNRDGCDTWNTFFGLAMQRKPDFDVYRITTPDPSVTSPLGNPNGGAKQNLFKTFFDNYDLQTYINAPHKKWNQCNTGVFVNGDQSPPPDASPSYSSNILANIVEKSTSGMIIMQGDEDALIITEGASVALQNLTWNGGQGFSKAPLQALIDVDGKQTGTFVSERGLTYAIIPDSGHMIPIDAQGTGLAALEVLLGQRSFSG